MVGASCWGMRMKCQSLEWRSLQCWKPMPPSEEFKESFFNVLLESKIKLISQSQPHQSNHIIECSFSNGIWPSLLLTSSCMRVLTLAPKENWNLRLSRKEKPHFVSLKIWKCTFLNFYFSVTGEYRGGSLYKYIIKIVSLFCFFPHHKVVRLL